MSIGMILLVVTAILTFFGITQRVLDGMHLTDRMALLMIALMFLGGMVPNIKITESISVNIGGAVVPIGICAYLIIKCDTNSERLKAAAAAVVTGVVIYVLGRIMPDEPEMMVLDPNYLFGFIGGITAFILGRSRRCAFIAGILGVIISQMINALVLIFKSNPYMLNLGGGGVFDTIVLSGIIAVVFTEITGEIIEKISEKRRGEV